jgi:hypothetical protein
MWVATMYSDRMHSPNIKIIVVIFIYMDCSNEIHLQHSLLMWLVAGDNVAMFVWHISSQPQIGPLNRHFRANRDSLTWSHASIAGTKSLKIWLISHYLVSWWQGLSNSQSLLRIHYCGTLSDLLAAIKQKHAHMEYHGVAQQYLSPCGPYCPKDFTLCAATLQHCIYWKVLDHPQYSLDLSPCDYHVFSLLTKGPDSTEVPAIAQVVSQMGSMAGASIGCPWDFFNDLCSSIQNNLLTGFTWTSVTYSWNCIQTFTNLTGAIIMLNRQIHSTFFKFLIPLHLCCREEYVISLFLLYYINE